MKRLLAIVLTGVMVLSVVAVSGAAANNLQTTPTVAQPQSDIGDQDVTVPVQRNRATNESDANDSVAGGPPNATPSEQDVSSASLSTDAAANTSIESRVFTLSDLVYFGYNNNTNISGPTGEFTVNDSEHHLSSVSQGFYDISSTQKFSLISGDPISQSVNGYFARADNERGTSTKLHTFVTSSEFGGEYFIVFAQNDNTEFTIKRSDTGEVIRSGTLNEGEHHAVPSSEVSDQFLTVTSDKPVSALSYFDQGYYTPAVNGRFVGETFYTFAGTITDGTNDLVVTGYEDGTSVTITNTTSGGTIASTSIDAGETVKHTFDSETYVTVKSSGDVSVSVQPYQSWESIDYHHMNYVPGKSGSLIDTEFYEATTDSDYAFAFAYQNNTNVTVTDPDTGTVQATYTLQEDDVVEVNPGIGVWKITANKSVSVQSGYGEWSADFGPLEFGTAHVSVTDYSVTPAAPDVNETITVNATVSNTGTQNGTVNVTFYADGSPIETRTVAVSQGETVYEEFTISFAESGTHNVTVNDLTATDIRVGGISLSLSPTNASASPGGNTTLDIQASDISNGVGAFNLNVSVDNTSVATITSIEATDDFPSSFVSISIASDGSEANIEAAAGDTADTGTVTIAPVTISAESPGTADISLSVETIGDEAGSPYTVSTVSNATLSASAGPPPVVGDQNPTDPDGDGVYEDINGDGEFDILDVQALFVNRDAATVTDNPQWYDFNDDGDVNIVDVQALFIEATG